jgi:GNAT superfamily N-acetyltransferase
MIPITTDFRRKLAPLFHQYRWNYLADTVLDGIAGRSWGDDEENPQVGVLEFPNIRLIVIGGNPAHPAGHDFLVGLSDYSSIVFACPGWDDVLKGIHKKRLVELERYAFTSENLDIEHLRSLTAQVPAGFELVRVDLPLVQKLAAEKSHFSEDHFFNFASLDDFIDRGFGFAILRGKEVISLATTFMVCTRGIEIQINTREAYQGKGLATLVAAQLLTYSLELGLDPNWDAANKTSVGLATKLGYTPQGTYTMHLITETPEPGFFGKVGQNIKAIFKA